MTGGRGPEWGAADGSLPAFPLSPGLSLCPYGRPQGQQIRPGLPSGSLVSSPNSGPSELHLGPPFWPGARRQGVWAGSESSGALGPPWVPALPVGFPRTALWTCAARGGGFKPWAGGPDPPPHGHSPGDRCIAGCKQGGPRVGGGRGRGTVILGRLFSWQRLLPRQFLPHPRPSTHYQLGVCVQTAAGLFCQLPLFSSPPRAPSLLPQASQLALSAQALPRPQVI